MSIPEECTVLVVGGGPGGSYAGSVLAREGINTVVLEADVFPRYHIGESMLASMRHFLRFIDLDDEFNSHGFNIKKGAAFKLNEKRTAYTDFVAAGGPGNYAWNVIRSEMDDLIFRHAGKSGAKIFDGVKVNSLEFVPEEGQNGTADSEFPNPGRPVSASWSRKDGSSGVLKFDYIIDASGRAGLMSTKYLKNRKNNQGLKNVASWGYWRGVDKYGVGTPREGGPFFEALTDASGWCWSIPLHNGTMSVGIVQNQELSLTKKRAMGSPSSKDFYLASRELAPSILARMSKAELVSDIKSASDWSYSASSYASPYARIVGDAGCFIDPYFSSGVHLALASALSAAMTICASRKGQLSEYEACKWHSHKVAEGYTRFLLVVLSALKQIRQQDEPVLSDWDEDGFDRAFAFFRPIIQGTADVKGDLTQAELSKTVDFCLNAFADTEPEERAAVLRKVDGTGVETNGTNGDASMTGANKHTVNQDSLTEDELRVLKTIRARQMLRTEDTLNLDNWSSEVINGYSPNVRRGALGLNKAPEPEHDGPAVPKAPVVDLFALVKDQEGAMQEQPQEPQQQQQDPIKAY